MGQKLSFYVFFAPEIMIVDCSALASFYQVKIKNSSILAKIPTFGAFFSRFNTYLHPANKSLHRLQFFSEKSGYAYEFS